jgi:hypothetical protein
MALRKELVLANSVACRGGMARHDLNGNKRPYLRAVSPYWGHGFGRDDREKRPFALPKPFPVIPPLPQNVKP